jgi:hypothetical protein
MNTRLVPVSTPAELQGLLVPRAGKTTATAAPKPTAPKEDEPAYVKTVGETAKPKGGKRK